MHYLYALTQITLLLFAELCFQNNNLNFTTGRHAKRFMKRIFLPSRIVNREKENVPPLFFKMSYTVF